MNTSEMPVQYVKGVGEKKAKLLQKLGIETLWDLVHYFPRSYIDLTNQLKINEIVPETVCCFRATVGFDCTSARVSSSVTILYPIKKATIKTTTTAAMRNINQG